MNFVQKLEALRKVAEKHGFTQELDDYCTYGNSFNERTITIDYYNKQLNILVSLVISKNELILTNVDDLSLHLTSRINMARTRRLVLIQEGHKRETL